MQYFVLASDFDTCILAHHWTHADKYQVVMLRQFVLASDFDTCILAQHWTHADKCQVVMLRQFLFIINIY